MWLGAKTRNQIVKQEYWTWKWQVRLWIEFYYKSHLRWHMETYVKVIHSITSHTQLFSLFHMTHGDSSNKPLWSGLSLIDQRAVEQVSPFLFTTGITIPQTSSHSTECVTSPTVRVHSCFVILLRPYFHLEYRRIFYGFVSDTGNRKPERWQRRWQGLNKCVAIFLNRNW